MSGYGNNKEPDFNKVNTLTGTDLVRVVASSASRNITWTNLKTLISQECGTTLRVVTSTTNYVATNANDVVLMDLTAGAASMTLPAASIAEGKLIQVKKIDATTNDGTVQTEGGNIDGSATATLSGSGGAKPGASFISDGSNWFILNA